LNTHAGVSADIVVRPKNKETIKGTSRPFTPFGWADNLKGTSSPMKTPSLRSLGLALLLPLAAALPARASLIYYLPFDDGTNANLTNYGSVSNDVDATTSGTAPTAVTNVAPNLGSTHAERTSASNTVITLPGSTTQARLTGSDQAMTISSWVYRDTTTNTFSEIVGTYSAGVGGWKVTILNAGAVRLEYIDSNGAAQTRTTVNSVSLQTWTHLSLVFNNTGAAIDAVKIYVNGVSLINSSSVSLMDPTDTPITLRSASNAQIVMDDFAMWDSALSAGQLRALYTAPTAIPTAGLNIGQLNPIFDAHTAASPSAVNAGGIAWTYATGFDVTAKALGDTWQSGANYYMWLGGDALNPTGMLGISMIPEPSTAAVLAGLAALGMVGLRRTRSR
jgi:hypothetical protein